MARTLLQIKKQIESLEREAETVRKREVAGVIERIKQAIDFYGLTVEDLFGEEPKSQTKSKAVPRQAAKKATETRAKAKYKDPDSGKTWTGHGKRPGWFLRAIESGKKAEELAV